jgi:hypothetical protein
MRLLLLSAQTSRNRSSRTWVSPQGAAMSAFQLVVLGNANRVLLLAISVGSRERRRLSACSRRLPKANSSRFGYLTVICRSLLISFIIWSAGLTHWQHPSFFAYFPTACTFEGLLADLYSSSTCNPGFNVGIHFTDNSVLRTILIMGPVVVQSCVY